MKNRLFIIFVFVFISVTTIAADDNNLDPWPVVKRCLPTPIVPDKNWSYDGEILMHGWAGIHAIRARSQMPYVVHWGDGILSLNGQWILTQEVDSHRVEVNGGGHISHYYNRYGNILVENLSAGRKINFSWQAYFEMDQSSFSYPYWPAGPLWLDNDHFAAFYGNNVETKVVNLETGEITSRPDIRLNDTEYSISPDQTRAISSAQLYKLPDNEIVKEEVGTNQDFESSIWSYNSSMFADLIQGQNNTSELTIFDREGKFIAAPFMSQAQLRIELGKFSSTSDYFSFTSDISFYGENHRYILDLRKKVIYDLCVDDAQGWAWSPDGSQFATILGQGQKPIVVVDMDDWQPRIIGYHDGSVLLWRSLS